MQNKMRFNYLARIKKLDNLHICNRTFQNQSCRDHTIVQLILWVNLRTNPLLTFQLDPQS